MAKRGFLAEVNHQLKQAEKRQLQQQRAAERARVAAVREAERARKAAERAQAQAARAAEKDRREADKAAQLAHVEAMQSVADSRSQELFATHDAIDSILAATLEVDDYVDLESLRTVVSHPPFPRPDLEAPLPPPAPPQFAPEPSYVEPEPPTGAGALIGKRKKHADLIAQARAQFAADHQAWQAHTAQVQAFHQQALHQHQANEAQRVAELERARQVYAVECQQREAQAAQADGQLDSLVAGLAAGSPAAIDEYVGIVLSNSVYPECFEVEHDFQFDAEFGELSLTVWIPDPDVVPTEKEYKYVKAKDEVVATQLSQKAQKDRYAGAVHQVALRSLHEVFEADREARIQTISLNVATRAVNPATGHVEPVPLAAVAAERSSFMAIDLSGVVPVATLRHLGAQISKNPHGLVAIDSSQGVRTR